MKPTRRVSRRSFMARVAGGGAFAFVGGKAFAFQVTDSDPSDPVGQGRGGGNSRPHTGVTDGDSGAGADPYGGGRGTRNPGAQDDRRGGTSGMSDSDSGPYADPAGNGRGDAGGGAGRRRGGDDPSSDCSAARQRRDEVQSALNRMGSEADHDARVRDLETARALDAERSRVLNDIDIDILTRESRVDEITAQLAEISNRHGLGNDGNYTVSSLERAVYGYEQQRGQREALERELSQLQAQVANFC